MSAQDIKQLGRYIKQIDSLFPDLVELKQVTRSCMSSGSYENYSGSYGDYISHVDTAINALGSARRELVVAQIEHEQKLQEQEDDDRPYP